MGLLSTIFSAGAEGVIKGVGDVIDRFVQTADEKAQVKLELARLVSDEFKVMEQSALATITSRTQVIVAELQHGDRYTKRTRPMIARWGLYVVLWNYAVVPTLGVLLQQWLPGSTITSLALPEEFWWAWGGIVGTYAIGRSFEKGGVMNRLSGLATGSRGLLDDS